MDKAIEKAVKELIPKGLDDIIRENKDKITLSMASLADIGELVGELKSGWTQAVMNDWRIVKTCVTGGGTFFMLLGDIVGDGSYATSNIEKVDFSRNLVKTKNSLYKLGTAGDGEPHQDQLIVLCAVMHGTPAGKFFGVPHFFFLILKPRC